MRLLNDVLVVVRIKQYILQKLKDILWVQNDIVHATFDNVFSVKIRLYLICLCLFDNDMKWDLSKNSSRFPLEILYLHSLKGLRTVDTFFLFWTFVQTEAVKADALKHKLCGGIKERIKNINVSKLDVTKMSEALFYKLATCEAEPIEWAHVRILKIVIVFYLNDWLCSDLIWRHRFNNNVWKVRHIIYYKKENIHYIFLSPCAKRKYIY